MAIHLVEEVVQFTLGYSQIAALNHTTDCRNVPLIQYHLLIVITIETGVYIAAEVSVREILSSYSSEMFVMTTDGPEHTDLGLNDYGELVVFMFNEWVHVANSENTWTSENSEVVCRQLGYDPYG